LLPFSAVNPIFGRIPRPCRLSTPPQPLFTRNSIRETGHLAHAHFVRKVHTRYP
jgi:hypothetical protein